jgi:hypothetical protein
MLNKHNLNIARLAAKDESRYTLQGILVSPEHTTCTDGHQLTRVTTPKMDPQAYPEVEGGSPATKTWEPFILPRDAALAISKAIPKSSTVPILGNAAIGEATNVNGHAQVILRRCFMVMPQRSKWVMVRVPNFAARGKGVSFA